MKNRVYHNGYNKVFNVSLDYSKYLDCKEIYFVKRTVSIFGNYNLNPKKLIACYEPFFFQLI